MKGVVKRISGPLVEADGMLGSSMHDVVRVGEEGLMAEVIKVIGDRVSLQAYEDTGGLKPGDRVVNTGEQLSVELGPGLLKSIYDGVQRPLESLWASSGDFIERGVEAPALDRKKKWHFTPSVGEGDKVAPGTVLGTTQESKVIEHRITAPPGVSGKVNGLKEGDFTVEDVLCSVGKQDLTMMQRWPVKTPRPVSSRLEPNEPLITGQRTIDVFFPIAKGGAAAIPGPFGAGKTVTQHQLARWVDADVIVYVGCGERGNEMTEVLDDFPKLKDPYSGEPLMERTVLIANTSNMPVAAREASVYTGVTIAEYYRDMGYNTALMADSTSRWAEALREISSRLEEMPGEEGFPAYLGSRLASFYERSGRVTCLNGATASTSIVGAVSPPGGDLSEPVTQNTLRIVRVFWSLDAKLADRRHFPAINWLTSYSLYKDITDPWVRGNVSPDMPDLRDEAMGILQRESELLEIVQLVGADALPDHERLVLETAKILREDFLQQDALHEVDSFCSTMKQHAMLSAILEFHRRAGDAIESGSSISDIMGSDLLEGLSKMKYLEDEKFKDSIEGLKKKIGEEMG
ncbi:MAG: V-type ATP synthase subunit A [Candidatus Altiarchaeales archaeon]|nr:V-type ATP synthase subunit A [Candidatus Altiarchaeales archaeon]MBD3415832.1 V-type ATP synthase subunit A [Candidatus Altiarchaeales archaeon]